MAIELFQASAFNNADIIIPVPFTPEKTFAERLQSK